MVGLIDSSSTSGCTISNSIVSYDLEAGTCVSDANQESARSKFPAPEVQRSVVVAHPPPVGEAGIAIDGADFATDSRSALLNLVWLSEATDVLVAMDQGFNAAGGMSLMPVARQVQGRLKSE